MNSQYRAYLNRMKGKKVSAIQIDGWKPWKGLSKLIRKSTSKEYRRKDINNYKTYCLIQRLKNRK